MTRNPQLTGPPSQSHMIRLARIVQAAFESIRRVRSLNLTQTILHLHRRNQSPHVRTPGPPHVSRIKGGPQGTQGQSTGIAGIIAVIDDCLRHAPTPAFGSGRRVIGAFGVQVDDVRIGMLPTILVQLLQCDFFKAFVVMLEAVDSARNVLLQVGDVEDVPTDGRRIEASRSKLRGHHLTQLLLDYPKRVFNTIFRKVGMVKEGDGWDAKRSVLIGKELLLHRRKIPRVPSQLKCQVPERQEAQQRTQVLGSIYNDTHGETGAVPRTVPMDKQDARTTTARAMNNDNAGDERIQSTVWIHEA